MKRASFTSSAILFVAPFPNAVTAAATTTRELIAGGQDAPKDRYQYFMYTNYEAFNFTGNCGATLIHPDIAMTAAHCLPFVNMSLVDSFVIGANFYNTSDIFTDVLYAEVDDFVLHPDNDGIKNDIGLMHLRTPITDVAPVRWNTDLSVPVDDTEVLVMGLGDTAENAMVFPNVLQEVAVNIINIDTCAEMFEATPNYTVTKETQLCANAPGKDSCVGDSGGPMILAGETAEDDLQIGIVSFGEGCARSEFPAGYTNVAAYTEWIQAYICEKTATVPEFCTDGASTSASRRSWLRESTFVGVMLFYMLVSVI